MTSARARRLLGGVGLVLAGANIALFGCSSDLPPGASDDTDGAGAIDGGTGAVTTDTGTSQATQGSDADTDESAPTAEASTTIPDSAIADAATSDGPVEANASYTCLDDDPAPDGGASLPTSCPGSTTCSAYCDEIHTNFKLGVAQTIIQCLLKQASCDEFSVANCISSVSERVCVDTSYQSQCTTLISNCDPTLQGQDENANVSDCVDDLSSFTAAGQNAWISCIQGLTAAGTCAGSYDSCFAQMYE